MESWTLFGFLFCLSIGALFGYFYGKVTTEKKLGGKK